MIKTQIGEMLKKVCSEEELRKLEAKQKKQLLEWIMKRTHQSREAVINAIKNSPRDWNSMYVAYRHKECANCYGFFGCECEGDMNKCPHSHAYYDITWQVDEQNGVIKKIDVGARICQKFVDMQNEKENADSNEAQNVYEKRRRK